MVCPERAGTEQNSHGLPMVKQVWSYLGEGEFRVGLVSMAGKHPRVATTAPKAGMLLTL